MPTLVLPAINQSVAKGWTEQQRDMYNYMPYYLAEQRVKKRERKLYWGKLLGKIKWTPNMGEVMKGVRKEPSPVMRQNAAPNELSTAARKDVMDIAETSVITTVKHHKFESPVFQFYPSFRDFMKNHVEVHHDDIAEKEELFNDMFLRYQVLNYAPHVYIPNRSTGTLVQTPSGPATTAADGTETATKTAAWFQNYVTQIGNPGNLSLTSINDVVTIMANDLNIPPYSGSNGEKLSGSGLTEKYLLKVSSEAYNQFFFDPWLLANRRIDLDVVTGPFKGDLWGQATCNLEHLPHRLAADGTFPAPEVRVVGTMYNSGNGATVNAPYNVGETIPNPDYVNAPFEIAYAIGGDNAGYESIEVGPPPKAFSGNGMPDGFGKMQWNGEIILTKNFLVPYINDAGETVYETNMYGEYVRFISHVTYGIMPRQRRNIVPIIFKRRRGPSV